ncbi:MAG: RHS repeat-associated core domain-containing protein [Terricaulis sp.]
MAANGAVSSTTDYEETTYNIAANTTTQRRRDGQVITLGADNLGRVTSVDAPGTGLDVASTYDLFSRTLSAASGGQSLSFAYDQLSRNTSQTSPQGSVSYLYDAASRRTRMTWPDGFYVAYDYDLAGAVTAMRENGAASGVGVLAIFAYDNLGRRTSLARGNGVATAYAYDPASRLATLTQDLAGTGQDQSTGLSYNAASQIIQRASSNAAYDFPAPVNGTITYADNGLNQYTSVAATTPSYDARGNTTSALGAAYAYDVYNRLTSATPPGGAAATLAYDALGRLSETVGAATTRFLYDGASMIGEYDGSNALQRRFVHGPGVDEPLVWYEGAGTTDRRWLLADQLGSVVAVTNAAGAATNINAYDEYGVPAATNTGRFQYTGQIWLNEAQLYHYKARAYLPSLGRFAQTDPIGFGGGMNLYAYVANRPTSAIDPSGLCETTTGSRICGGGGAGVGPIYATYYSGSAPQSAYARAQQQRQICGADCVGVVADSDVSDDDTIDSIVVTGRRLIAPYILGYNPLDLNFHFFEVGPTRVCFMAHPGCNFDDVDAFVAGEHVPWQIPANEGPGQYDLLATQPIEFWHQGGVFINQTLEGHMFHDGRFVTVLFAVGPALYLFSTGIGTGGYREFNEWIGPILFGGFHGQTQNRFRGFFR